MKNTEEITDLKEKFETEYNNAYKAICAATNAAYALKLAMPPGIDKGVYSLAAQRISDARDAIGQIACGLMP